MADYELHIHNLKDGSERMIPFDDFVAMNGHLRRHPEYKFGHLYRIYVMANFEGTGKLTDISDSLVLQIDPELTLKYVLK